MVSGKGIPRVMGHNLLNPVYLLIMYASCMVAWPAGGCSGCEQPIMVGDALSSDASDEIQDPAMDDVPGDEGVAHEDGGADAVELDVFHELPDGPLPSVASAHEIDGGMNFEVRCVVETGDSRYVMAGNIWSVEDRSSDLWLAAIEDGALAWQRTLGGTGGDAASSVILCRDGGFAVVGSSSSFYGNNLYAWIIKTDGGGNILWQKALLDQRAGYARAVVEDREGNLMVFGRMDTPGSGLDLDPKGWMLKLDENGELLVQKSIGGDRDDELTAAVELADGSIAALGTTSSFGSGASDVWVIKVDSDLNVLWQKAIGSDESDWAPEIAAGTDNSVLVAWSAPSEIGWGSDMRVARLDREGNLVFERIVGTASDSSAGSVAATQDGGFVLSGSTYIAGDDFASMGVARFDADGEMVWQVGLGRGYFTVISVHESADGSVDVLGNQYQGDFGGYIGARLIRLVMEDGVPGSCNLLEPARMDLMDGSSAVTDSDAAAVDTAGVPFEPAPTEVSSEVQVTQICPES